jgi:hypothetical protein
MKPLKQLAGSGRISSLIPPALGLLILLSSGSVICPGGAFGATNTVTSLADRGAGSLRQIIADSVSGDCIVVGVRGTIQLTSGELALTKDLTLLGPGHEGLALSGNWQNRVLRIATNVNAQISGLAITAGQTGPGQPGGGIFNSGTLTLIRCGIFGNATGAGADGGNAQIYGGSGGSAGNGGGLFNAHAVTLIECSVRNNSCGNGGMGGFGQVGGGSGGNGGWGGGVYSSGFHFAMSGCTVANNCAGTGGTGGSSSAGPAAGGWGGFGGGVYSERSCAATNCTVAGNAAGYGGAGGWRTSYPFGQAGYGNGGSGGGVSAGTNSYIIACTIAGNFASIVDPGGGNQAGGIHARGEGTSGGVLNSIVAQNTGLMPDVAGGFHSLGRNLIGMTNGSSGFTAAGDLVGSSDAPLKPLVSALLDHGGPTLTMALQPGSPAIEAGTNLGVPGTDQRGVVRPQGAGADIGAYEFEFIPRIVGARLCPPSGFWLKFCGVPGRIYVLQSASNLVDWLDLTHLCPGANGLCEFTDLDAGGGPVRFFRTKLAVVTP